MTVMQQAFADAERANARHSGVPIKQRVWNVIYSNPGFSAKDVKDRLKDCRPTSVMTALGQLIDRGMVTYETYRVPTGQQAYRYKVVGSKYVLQPLPEKVKAVNPEAVKTPSLPATTPHKLANQSLMEQVMAAPFTEVLQLYEKLKDRFRD